MKGEPTGRFVIYSRKSRCTGKGESIENQIELCRQYLAAHYSREAAQTALVYEDEGFSGGTLDRPRFRKMMDDSRTIPFAAIVVYRLDRISRNIGDFAGLIRELGEREIGFISIREQFDTASPMGRAMMYIASVFSQLERETIAERIRDNMHELAKTGRWLGGTTPTGFEAERVSRVSVDGKMHKACRLKPIPEEIRLVRQIFHTFLETGSLTKTEQLLAAEGYRTKRGKAFTRFAVRGILTNPVYMVADGAAYDHFAEKQADLPVGREGFDGEHGIMAYNRTLQRPGRATREKPVEEWIVAVGGHRGVIPGTQWIQVQELLARNRSKSYGKPRSQTALLPGLLRCGKCGSHMRPKCSGGRGESGEPAYIYLCTGKERSAGRLCQMNNAAGNRLDAGILAALAELCRPEPCGARELAGLKKQLRVSCREREEQASAVRAQLEENQKAIRTLVASLGRAAGTTAENYILEQISALHEKGEALSGCLVQLEALRARQDLGQVEVDRLRRQLAGMDMLVKECSVEQKRAFLRALVRKVVWDGENAHVYLLHSGEEERPLGEDSK